MWAACLALLILAACGPRTRPEMPRVATRDITFQSAGYRLEGTLTFGAGASYWKQWIEYSTSAPARLAELPAPLLLMQCLGDHLESLRAAAARNRLAQLRELPAHDHFAMRPGENEASPEFMETLIRWLRQAPKG